MSYLFRIFGITTSLSSPASSTSSAGSSQLSSWCLSGYCPFPTPGMEASSPTWQTWFSGKGWDARRVDRRIREHLWGKKYNITKVLNMSLEASCNPTVGMWRVTWWPSHNYPIMDYWLPYPGAAPWCLLKEGKMPRYCCASPEKVADSDTFFFSDLKISPKNSHTGVGVLSSSTGLTAELTSKNKQTNKQNKNHMGGGGETIALPPPRDAAPDLINKESTHK